MGAILRNEKGEVIMSMSQVEKAMSMVHHMEALYALRGLQIESNKEPRHDFRSVRQDI